MNREFNGESRGEKCNHKKQPFGFFMEHLFFVSKNIHLIRLENRENQKKWAKRNTNCVVARLVGMGYSPVSHTHADKINAIVRNGL